jgi:hypothetical protein
MIHSTVEPERRRSPRKALVMESWIWSPTAREGEIRIAVKSIDLSTHGVAFDCEKQLPTHAFFKIEIAVGEQKLVCEVRTISVREKSQGVWHVGAEFL